VAQPTAPPRAPTEAKGRQNVWKNEYLKKLSSVLKKIVNY
jgi:hypothetical protein